jgi:hypothetical protein
MGVYQRGCQFERAVIFLLAKRAAKIYTASIRRGPSGLERRPSEVHLQRKSE